MKKSIFILAVAFFCNMAVANTIEIQDVTVADKELGIDPPRLTSAPTIAPTVAAPYIGGVIGQISICAQVQMDVKETFTLKYPGQEDKVNQMALGAFMGCMGWL